MSRPTRALVPSLLAVALIVLLVACGGRSASAAPCTIDAWYGAGAGTGRTASITMTATSANPSSIPPTTRFLWVSTPKAWESEGGTVGSVYPEATDLDAAVRLCAVNVSDTRRSLFRLDTANTGLAALDFSVPGVPGLVSLPFKPPLPPADVSDTTILTP
jgi:hypothetical protein